MGKQKEGKRRAKASPALANAVAEVAVFSGLALGSLGRVVWLPGAVSVSMKLLFKSIKLQPIEADSGRCADLVML